MLNQLTKELQKLENPEKAKVLRRFFKTEKNQYGEGDIFLGIMVPEQRKIAKKYSGLSLAKIQELLNSNIHEYRSIGLLILLNKFEKENEIGKGNIFNFYLKNTKNINNWDLVDLTAHKIVGEFLRNKKRDELYKLAESRSLWEKRISIISCFAYIKNEDFKEALNISKILLQDEHDLIHKAVGWVLREIGKKDLELLETFLKKNYKIMPRTMLRYSIEKFPEDKRKKYLEGKIL